jgi:hypothetical protein
MNINLMVFKTKEKNMKKNFTQLVIAIGAVTIVAALTGGAVFAFSDGQSKEFLPFLPGSSIQHETPEPPTGTTSVVIKGVITDMTATHSYWMQLLMLMPVSQSAAWLRLQASNFPTALIWQWKSV